MAAPPSPPRSGPTRNVEPEIDRRGVAHHGAAVGVAAGAGGAASAGRAAGPAGRHVAEEPGERQRTCSAASVSRRHSGAPPTPPVAVLVLPPPEPPVAEFGVEEAEDRGDGLGSL